MNHSGIYSGSLAYLIAAVFTTPSLADSPQSAPAYDYFSIDLGQLVSEADGSNVISDPPLIDASFVQIDQSPHVVVPLGSDAAIVHADTNGSHYRGFRIVGRKPAGEAIEGDVYVLKRDPQQSNRYSLLKLQFNVGENPQTKASREDFLTARGNAALQLWSDGVAGSAIFRHLAHKSLGEVGQDATPSRARWSFSRRNDVSDTIRMSSGGRAVSENLDLDSQLQLNEDDRSEWVALSEIDGITVRPIDWSQWLVDEPTELDPLTQLVPHDQYVILLPSFAALTRIIDRGDEMVRSVSHWFEPAARRTDVLQAYQSQLGLPLNQLTRQLGGTLIDEIAVTGSDPYFRTGTDLAVLMRSKQPTLLQNAIVAQITAESAKFDSVEMSQHKSGNITFAVWSNPRRDFSSAVAVVGQSVVVANSPVQMKRILQTSAGEIESMHDLDEYRFFRQRYRLQSQDESALVILTDAAIRKWCSPRWRIAASRRTRARISIAEATAEHADQIVRGKVNQLTAIDAPEGAAGLGQMWLTTRGVHSERFGSLQFQTPIAEMEFSHVTQGEREMYNQWRRRYERQWSQVFDPIAVKVSLDESSLHADLSVIPLVVQSDYRWMREISGETRLSADAGDPHEESLARWTLAIDPNSSLLQSVRGIIASQAGALGNQAVDWLDGSVTVYFDKDEDWIKRIEAIDRWERDDDVSIRELPIGVFLPSKNSFGLAAFITAARGLVDSASPNLIRWETIDHQDLKYVRGTMITRSIFGQPEETPQLYYATTPDGLTLSLNAHVVERALERHIARQGKDAEPQQAEAIEHTQRDEDPRAPQLDDSPSLLKRPQLIVEATGNAAKVISLVDYRSGSLRMQRLAWSNIPILNYLRHQYPDRDPVRIYEQLFGQQLIEPTDGKYEWNDRLQTYVSTEQGFRLDPKFGPPLPPAFNDNDRLTTTLSFQDGGLRATLAIELIESE